MSIMASLLPISRARALVRFDTTRDTIALYSFKAAEDAPMSCVNNEIRAF
jgi:hypothetical protein